MKYKAILHQLDSAIDQDCLHSNPTITEFQGNIPRLLNITNELLLL